MDGRVCRVDADGNSPYPCIPQPCCHGTVEEVPAGAHHHPEPAISTIAGNGAEIGPHEWLSPGEDDNRRPDVPYLVDHPQCLVRGEHSCRFVLPCSHVAVGALQGTFERDIPRDETRRSRRQILHCPRPFPLHCWGP